LIYLTHLVKSILILNDLRMVLSSIHHPLSMTYGLMRESVVQNTLRLQRSALALVIIGNLKLIMLQLLTHLFQLPRLLFPSHSALLVQ